MASVQTCLVQSFTRIVLLVPPNLRQLCLKVANLHTLRLRNAEICLKSGPKSDERRLHEL